MLMPSIFGESLFDDWFDDLDKEFFGKKNPLYGKHSRNMMKTDVRETEGTYELDVDLPGLRKRMWNWHLNKDIWQSQLKRALNKDERIKKDKYIPTGRYAGAWVEASMWEKAYHKAISRLNLKMESWEYQYQNRIWKSLKTTIQLRLNKQG